MTAGNFIDGPELEEASSYPVVFGITLTPTVSGLLLVLLGGVGAFYIYQNLVSPVLETNAQLQAEVSEKEALLVDTGELERQINEAKERLTEAEALRGDVRGLFATEDSLDTLLFDVNARVQSANLNVPEGRRAQLTKFELDPASSGVITDSSFGADVNNRLERRVFNVEMQGDFAQTQSIIRSIERLQPLMVLRNFNSELDTAASVSQINERGEIVVTDNYVVINTSFQLNVLLPAPEGTYEEANAPAEGEEGEEGEEESN